LKLALIFRDFPVFQSIGSALFNVTDLIDGTFEGTECKMAACRESSSCQWDVCIWGFRFVFRKRVRDSAEREMKERELDETKRGKGMQKAKNTPGAWSRQEKLIRLPAHGDDR
jgi:hypothetical protein